MRSDTLLNSVGIGTDIELIARFRNLKRIKDKKFFSKIFTSRELDYCFAKKNVAQHLAARYAAKEAVIKALGELNIGGLGYKAIEVSGQKNKAPRVTVVDKRSSHWAINLSISHCQDYALAFALVIKLS